MAKVIVALAAAFLLAQDRPGQPGQDKPGQPGMDRTANQDLDRALAKAGEMNNYSANLTFKKDGTGKDAKDSLQPIEIRVQDGIAHLKSGSLEAYRKGDVFISKEGGSWKRADSSSMDRGGRQPGDRPTDRPADRPTDRPTDRPSGDQPNDDQKPEGQQPGGKQPGSTQEPRTPGQTGQDQNVSIEKLQSCRLPHEVLKELKSSSFKQVRREDTEGSRVFSGELTDAAIRQLMANKKGVGASDPSMAQGTGSARIWINGEGIVNKYEIVIDHKGNKDLGKTDGMEGKMTKTVEIRDIGSTKYDVPADAKKLFDAKSTDKPSDRPMDKPSDKPEDKKDDKKAPY
jgi:hypothetical protein